MGRKVEARQTGVRNCRGGYGFTSCTSTAQTNAFLPSHGGYINVGLIQAAHPPRQHMCLEMQYSETMVAIIHGPAWLWWNGEHEVNVLAEVKAWLEISNRKSLVRYMYQTEMWFQTKKYAAEIPFERRLNGESAGVVEWALGEKVPVQGPDRWEGARMQRRDRCEKVPMQRPELIIEKVPECQTRPDSFSSLTPTPPHLWSTRGWLKWRGDRCDEGRRRLHHNEDSLRGIFVVMLRSCCEMCNKLVECIVHLTNAE